MNPYAISATEQRILFDKISQWMIQTPPLLRLLGERAHPFLPHPPPKILPYQGNSRLGFWYQHLCHQFFASHPHYQVLAQEIQLNDEHQTIGALDFLLQNQLTQQVEHWEVAIKFYILYNGFWYGPNSRDRLDLKLSHMLNHQLSLSQHPCFHARFPTIKHVDTQAFIQGRLYLNPFNSDSPPTNCLGFSLEPSQMNGRWCFAKDYHRINEPLYLLKKGQWITGRQAPLTPVTSIDDAPIHCQSESGVFWFILPDTWPQ